MSFKKKVKLFASHIVSLPRLITQKYEDFAKNRNLVLFVLGIFILFSAFNKSFKVEYSFDEITDFTNTAIFAGIETNCYYWCRDIDSGIFPSIFRVPIVWLSGGDFSSLGVFRITSGIIAVLTMFIAFLAAENFFGRKVAFLAAIFYAISPTWMYFNKWNFSFAIFSALLLYSLSLYYKKKEDKYLILNSFFCGLALVRHFLLLYMVVPVLLIRFFVFKKKPARLDFVFFFIGFLPYIIVFFTQGLINEWYYTLFSQAGLFSEKETFVSDSRYNNLAIFDNLLKRFVQFNEFFFLPHMALPDSTHFPFFGFSTFFLFSLASLYFLLFRDKSLNLPLVSLVWLFIFLSVFSPTDIFYWHLSPLTILPFGLVVSFLYNKKNIFVPQLLAYALIILIWYMDAGNFLNPLNNHSEIDSQMEGIEKAINYTSSLGIKRYLSQGPVPLIHFLLTDCSIDVQYISYNVDPYCNEVCFFSNLDNVESYKIRNFVDSLEQAEDTAIVLDTSFEVDKIYSDYFSDFGLNPNKTLGRYYIYIL